MIGSLFTRNWYRSAQAIRHEQTSKYYETVQSQEENADELADEGPNTSLESRDQQYGRSAAASAASLELHVHELVALASCFIFPVAGTWLLHAIRSGLSRPSEGLVSNYNLTIFLLASEIRPFSHILRMIQSRTLFLQRVVASSSASGYEDDKLGSNRLRDLSRRLEELEAHVARTGPTRLSLSDVPSQNDSQNSTQDQPSSSQDQQDILLALTPQITTEVRRAFQPEIDALNRAVRRYERRSALGNYQTEVRFQRLESQIRDAVAPPAAEQRSDVSGYAGFLFGLLAWVHPFVAFPVRIAVFFAYLPARIASSALRSVKFVLGVADSADPRMMSKVGPPPGQRASAARRPQRGKQKQPVYG